jgi:hypothetical protein
VGRRIPRGSFAWEWVSDVRELGEAAMETTALTLGRVSLALPAGFQEMAAAELKEAFGFSYDAWAGARDPARHVMVAIIANEVGRLVGALASAGDAVMGIERRMRAVHGEDGYAFERKLKGMVAGIGARGFSYRFRTCGVDHVGEVWCLKRERTFYSIYLYGRAADAEGARAAFAEVLSGARIA